MTNRDSSPREELDKRIKRDIEHFEERLPERNAIAWRGYLAALLEWGLINIGDYDGLVELLPAVNDDPAAEILRGRD